MNKEIEIKLKKKIKNNMVNSFLKTINRKLILKKQKVFKLLVKHEFLNS